MPLSLASLFPFSPPSRGPALLASACWALALLGAALLVLAIWSALARFLASGPTEDTSAQPLARGQAFRRPPSRPWNTVRCLGFLSLYLVTIGWFSIVDVYRSHFFEPGHATVYLAYNTFRVLYGLYMAWILYFLGATALRLLERGGAQFPLGLLDRFVLCFFTGSAILHVIFFGLGYLGLYYRAVAVGLTVPLVVLSYPEFQAFSARLRGVVLETYQRNESFPAKYARSILLTTCAFMVFLLLVAKGLFPVADHDYAEHYFPYYKRVIESHNLWPNDVWYHYHVSKGSGAVFLSMLLTDLLATPLVTYVFFLASGLALFSLIRKAGGSSLWALLGLTVYLGGLVSAPGWGQFEKPHLLMASLLGALVWMLTMLDDRTEANRKAWTFLSVLTFAGLLIFAPTSFPFVFLLCMLGAAVALLRRQYARAKSLLVIGLGGGVILGGMLATNYMTTGLAEVTPFRFFWRYADQDRFSKWVSPYLWVLLEEGSAPGVGDLGKLDAEAMSQIEKCKQLFHLDVIQPLYRRNYVVVALIFLASFLVLSGRRAGPGFWQVALPTGGMLGVAFVLAQTVNQPVSMYRYYAFTAFFLVIAIALLWALVAQLMVRRRARMLFSYFFAVTLACWAAASTVRDYPRADLAERLEFVTGRLSLAGAFASQGVSSSEEDQEISNIVGPRVRVWCFNKFRYCMVSDSDRETMPSFSMSKDWHEIVFGPPEKAKELLREQRLNYFLLDLRKPFFDLLVYSPLFRPEHVQENLEIAWQWEDTYVLTWQGNGTQPLTPEFIQTYRKHIVASESGCDFAALYERIRTIYEQNKDQPYPIRRDPNLPPLKGWQ